MNDNNISWLAIILGVFANTIIIITFLILVMRIKKTPAKKSTAISSLKKVYLSIMISLTAVFLVIGLAFLGKFLLGVMNFNLSYGYENVSYNYDKAVYPGFFVPENTDPEQAFDDFINNGGVTTWEFNCDYKAASSIIYINEQPFCVKAYQDQADLIFGIIITTLMLGILLGHIVMYIKSEKITPNKTLKRIFLFGNLIIYSIGGLFLIPVAIYQTLNYFWTANKPVLDSPGMLASLSFFVLVSWMLWLVVVLRNKDLDSK